MGTGSNVYSKKRIVLILTFFFFVFLILLFRLIWIQFYKSEFYHQKALENRMRSIPVEPKRGTIFDRNGNELAISASADTLIAIPAEVDNPEEIAKVLAPIINMEEEELYKKLTKRSALVFIKRKLEKETVDKIKALTLNGEEIIGKGIDFTEEGKRYYPKGKLASHVLGISGIDSQGLEGIEFEYDDKLRGQLGKLESERDAKNRAIPNGVKRYIPPKNGQDMYLTIDEVIQYIAERELAKAVNEHQLKSGTIIVVRPQTGEVLAMANYPDYDPNKFGEYPSENRRNIAITDNYEPGSTFKIIVAAAAIEEMVVNLEGDSYSCGGSIQVPGGRIRCHKASGHGQQTFREIVENSCNVGFVTVGLHRLGAERLYKYIEGFGFGEKTNISLPGEARGIVRKQESIKPIEIATMSIGQGIAVTPIQLIMAVSAVANGGTLLEPQLVKEFRDSDTGAVVSEFTPVVVRRVISKETSEELRDILESVVTEGTGKRAYIEGYRVAGKTGTAQKVGPGGGYISGKYVASFAGFAPANDPQVAVLVVLDEPKGEYYGGLIAAPVFKAVMEDTLEYMGVKPQMIAEEIKKETIVKVPEVRNLPLEDAKRVLNNTGLNYIIEGEGTMVIEQTPKTNAQITIGSNVILYLGEELVPRENQEVTVPDIEGKTMREAAEILSAMGLKLSPTGSGIAVKQSPAPGSKMTVGMTIYVTFEPRL